MRCCCSTKSIYFALYASKPRHTFVHRLHFPVVLSLNTQSEHSLIQRHLYTSRCSRLLALSFILNIQPLIRRSLLRVPLSFCCECFGGIYSSNLIMLVCSVRVLCSQQWIVHLITRFNMVLMLLVVAAHLNKLCQIDYACRLTLMNKSFKSYRKQTIE